jgi:hypothetical protein
MALLVDTVRVDPAQADAYLALIETTAVPIMRDAGAALAACWSTSRELGEDVEVLVAWSVGDHERWNEIRKNLVLDPRWHRYGSEAARLRKGGSRRFHHAAGFSPSP